MSENCSHNCGSCSEECSERDIQSFLEKPNEQSKINKVIGIVSGKGGVGKSLVTGLTAVLSQRNGFKTAILDADITGPSIPKMFGVSEKALGTDLGILPGETKTGIKIMSLNLLIENDTDPVVWRGPIIGNAVKQFWTDVIWGDIDFMFIDMPPGTGDVPLTVFQSIPVDGIIVVASPQELVSMIVEKAVNMANMMNIPIIGLVENMSYVKCPDCGKEIKLFGESHIEEVANTNKLSVLGRIPIEPELAAACDNGVIEQFNGNWLDTLANKLKCLINDSCKKEDSNMKIAVASMGNMVAEHFGHCENFNLYQCENGKVVSSENVTNPGHKPGFLPNFLGDRGVEVIIAGGMGGGAIDIFNERNIEVIVGAAGAADKAVVSYLAGQLKSTGSVCHEHAHADECGEH